MPDRSVFASPEYQKIVEEDKRLFENWKGIEKKYEEFREKLLKWTAYGTLIGPATGAGFSILGMVSGAIPFEGGVYPLAGATFAGAGVPLIAGGAVWAASKIGEIINLLKWNNKQEKIEKRKKNLQDTYDV